MPKNDKPKLSFTAYKPQTRVDFFQTKPNPTILVQPHIL